MSWKTWKNISVMECHGNVMEFYFSGKVMEMSWNFPQWLRRCITKPTVVGSILADPTASTDFVLFTKVLSPIAYFQRMVALRHSSCSGLTRLGNYFFY